MVKVLCSCMFFVLLVGCCGSPKSDQQKGGWFVYVPASTFDGPSFQFSHVPIVLFRAGHYVLCEENGEIIGEVPITAIIRRESE